MVSTGVLVAGRDLRRDVRRDDPLQTEPVAPGAGRAKVVGGRFAIERLIARGGMGAVYLAHQLNLGRPVALKIMSPPPDTEEGDSFQDRFRLEAETLAALHHPNIVTVYDYGPTDDGRFYLALEYIEGPRLTDLIRKGRLSPERCIRLMIQVCHALRYAHKRGVVHRDLKPSNLLIRVEDGVETVKVVDFGLVKVAEADQSLTRAGLVLGSPHCMAPEQVRGEEIDHRADLYAVGILLFRCLTGHWPFHAETVAGTMIAHVHEERPTFHSVAPDLMVPDGLEAIVQRLLRRNPAERFADAGELMEALARCLDVPEDQFLTVSSTSNTLRPPVAPPDRPRRPRFLVPLAVALLLILAMTVAALLRVPARPVPAGGPLLPAEDPGAATSTGAPSPPQAPPPEEVRGDPPAPPVEGLVEPSPAEVPPPDPAPPPGREPQGVPSSSPPPASAPVSKPVAGSTPAPRGSAAPAPSPEKKSEPPPKKGEAEAPAGFLPLPDDF